MHRKLDCECTHSYDSHLRRDVLECEECPCTAYDPAGHNPELENILCPRCRKVRLEKPYPRTYMCQICNYVMFEKQVLEALG